MLLNLKLLKKKDLASQSRYENQQMDQPDYQEEEEGDLLRRVTLLKLSSES